MARVTPRQGRYAKLVTAFLLYFLYNNGIGIAQKLVAREDLHPAIGVWPVHLVFGVAAVVLLLHQSSTGWRRPRLPRLRRAS